MEFKLLAPNEGKFDVKIDFNFNELKTQIAQCAQKYKNLIYTPEQIGEAKADRAQLNKLKTSLEDERKRIKKDYLKPYDAFEAKVKELVVLIDEPINMIDAQIKNKEEKDKTAKKEQIQKFFNDNIGELKELITFEKIFDDKWLNVTARMSNIEKEISEKIAKISAQLKVISSFKLDKDIEFSIRDKYLQTLDFTAALEEKSRLEKLKSAIQEQEQKKILENLKEEKEETNQIEKPLDKVENKIYERKFWVKGTKEQLIALAEYMEHNNIEYGGIK